MADHDPQQFDEHLRSEIVESQKTFDKGLRSEIVESQKTQADFLKWKLISVSTVAFISLGFSPTDKPVPQGAKLLLCLVPLICLYVDLISLHIMIRIITIGVYVKIAGSLYERLTFEVRSRSSTNPFVFEAAALHGLSLVFNLVLIALGFTLPVQQWISPYLSGYILAGGLGLVATILSWVLYNNRAKEVIGVAEKFAKELGFPWHA